MAGKNKNKNREWTTVKYMDMRGFVSIEERATSRKLKGETKKLPVGKFKAMVKQENLLCMDLIGYDLTIGGSSKENGIFWCPSIVEEEFHRQDTNVWIVDDVRKEQYACVRNKFEACIEASDIASKKLLEEEEAGKQVEAGKHIVAKKLLEEEEAGKQVEAGKQEQQEESSEGKQVEAGKEEQQEEASEGDMLLQQQEEVSGNYTALDLKVHQEPLCYFVDKGKQVSCHDIFLRLNSSLIGLTESIKLMKQETETSFETLKQETKKIKDETKKIKDGMEAMHLDISSLSERQSKNGFASFFASHNPTFSVLYPVARMLLPYSPFGRLEKVAKLCGKLVEKEGSTPSLRGRQTPKHVEIDLVMKVKGPEGPLYFSPKSNPTGATTSSSCIVHHFSHLLVGELTRSTKLCSSSGEWEMPTQLANTSSSKLLYKLVQLERGIHATINYYNVPELAIFGACVLSPSFRELSDPEHLLDVVLDDVGKALPCLRRLSGRGRLWLMDL